MRVSTLISTLISTHTHILGTSFICACLLLTGSLNPGQRYYYIYGDYYGWSDESNFVAAPKAGDDVTTTVIAFGGLALIN